MKTMKRCLSVIAALAMVFTLALPLSAGAEENPIDTVGETENSTLQDATDPVEEKEDDVQQDAVDTADGNQTDKAAKAVKANADTKAETDAITVKTADDTEQNCASFDEIKLADGMQITLNADVALSKQLYIHGVENIVLDGAGHSITAAEGFRPVEGNNSLVKVYESSNIQFQNISLKASAVNGNKPALDVVSSSVVLDGSVSLSNEDTWNGVLNVNGKYTPTSVSVRGALTLNGAHMAIDMTAENAELTFEETASLNIENGFIRNEGTIVNESPDIDLEGKVLGGEFIQSRPNDTIEINTAEELIKAIQNQKDGQTWVIANGTYDIGCAGANVEINGHTGFVFPITADGITIKGANGADSNVEITSSYTPGADIGGVWNWQNFMTVAGENLTIQDVNLKGNPNGYMAGLCNKVIEQVGDGTLTLNHVECLPLTYSEDGTQFSGSIYIGNGSASLTDVKLYSWISARNADSAELNGVEIDFTNNTYAGADGYGIGASGDNVTVGENGFTIKVDSNTDLIGQVIDSLRPGTTIELTDDIEISEGLYIVNKDNITIRGNGHTIKAADDFAVNEYGQNNLVKVDNSDNVVFDNVRFEGTEDSKHVLDVYQSDNLLLNDVTLNHEHSTNGAPLINNGSDIHVDGTLTLVLGDGSWYTANVDDKNGDAKITFEENGDLVIIDHSTDKDKPGIVVEDTNPDNEAGLVDNSSKMDIVKSDDGSFVRGEEGVNGGGNQGGNNGGNQGGNGDNQSGDKNNSQNNDKKENGAPQTGDTAHPGVYVIILLASAAVAVYAVSRRRAR